MIIETRHLDLTNNLSSKYWDYILENVLGISVDETEGMSFAVKTPSECLKLAEAIECAISEIEWVDNPSAFDYLETGIEAAAIEYKNDCEYAALSLRRLAQNLANPC